MFNKLTDFTMQRTAKQAFGFWLVYFMFGVLIGAVSGAAAGAVTGDGESGYTAGIVASVIYVALLSAAICMKKSLSIGWYLLAVLAPMLAIFGGALIGLVPTAVLTTRPSMEDPAPDSTSS